MNRWYKRQILVAVRFQTWGNAFVQSKYRRYAVLKMNRLNRMYVQAQLPAIQTCFCLLKFKIGIAGAINRICPACSHYLLIENIITDIIVEDADIYHHML